MIARLRTLAKALAPSTSTQPAVPRTQQEAGESGSPHNDLDALHAATQEVDMLASPTLGQCASLLLFLEHAGWKLSRVTQPPPESGSEEEAAQKRHEDLGHSASESFTRCPDPGCQSEAFNCRQPESGPGEEGKTPFEQAGDLTRWILDSLDRPADDPSDQESHNMQKRIEAVISRWFDPYERCGGEPGESSFLGRDHELADRWGYCRGCPDCFERPTQPLQGPEVEREGDRWVIWKNDSGQGISSGPDIEPERPGLMGAEWARAATAMVMRVSEFHERHEEIERLTLERDMARGQSGLKPFTGDDGEQYSPATPREQQYLAASVVSQRKAKELEAQLQRVEEERDEAREQTEAMAWAAGWETDGWPPFDWVMNKFLRWYRGDG